ncbi:DUF1269 domain-containing protein [Limnospira platensis]|uniref:DUF1269 domain-containing protein n=1 Tax=Limnospira platensis TaxID=118562 RepID=UPI003D6FD26F
MATLTVWKYNSADGAKNALTKLAELQKQRLIQIEDAAIVFWPQGRGALAGALSGYFTDYGIDDDFIKDVRNQVTEGTSALFLLTSSVTLDKVEEAFKDEEKGELIKSNLTNEQEAKLREDFGADE